MRLSLILPRGSIGHGWRILLTSLIQTVNRPLIRSLQDSIRRVCLICLNPRGHMSLVITIIKLSVLASAKRPERNR